MPSRHSDCRLEGSGFAPSGGDVRLCASLPALLAGLSGVSSRAEFAAWAGRDLVRYFPHGACSCCLCRIDHDMMTPVDTLYICHAASAHGARLPDPAGLHREILRRWLRSGAPVLGGADAGGLAHGVPAGDLRHLAAHGMLDLSRHYVLFFSFYRLPRMPGEEHARALELLVPFLYAAMLRVLHREADEAGRQRLSPREAEVLGWIARGKTNAEIAAILGTRYRTVKNQVQSVLAKLEVSNRAQAVAKATRLGL